MGTENTDGGTLQKQNFINYYVQHIVVFRLLLLIYTSLEKKVTQDGQFTGIMLLMICM